VRRLPAVSGKWRRGRFSWPSTEGWLSGQVTARLESDRPRPRRGFRQWLGRRAVPDRGVAWSAILLVAILVPVSWALSAWGPQIGSDFPGIDTLTPQGSRALLGVLWQVHVAVAVDTQKAKSPNPEEEEADRHGPGDDAASDRVIGPESR
jgi:hypothetical protein